MPRDLSLRNDYGDQGVRIPDIDRSKTIANTIKKGDLIDVVEGSKTKTVRVTSVTPQFMAIEEVKEE